jgi:hypothetical protein
MTSTQYCVTQDRLPLVCCTLALSAAVAPAPLLLGQNTGNGRYDLDHDGQISPTDVALLAEDFGPCQGCRLDLNGDGQVNDIDLKALLAHVGESVKVRDQHADGAVVVHEAFPGRMPADRNPAPPVVPVNGDLKRDLAAGKLHDLGDVPHARITLADQIHETQYQGMSPAPYRIGFTRQFDPPLWVPQAATMQQLAENEFLWSFAVRSPGSHETRLHLEEFDVGRSQVILFARRADGWLEVHGPYTGAGPEGDGDFWPPSVPGDTVFVEVRGPNEPRFKVIDIVHNDRDRIGPPVAAAGDAEGGIAGSCVSPNSVLGCELDVMCESVNVDARQATGQMSYISGGNNKVCTGTLLNDLDDETAVPYFITAFHCLNTQAEVNTLQVTWFFQNTSCNGAIGTTQVSSGGTLLATNDTDGGNDMTFIRLNSAPAGTSLAGWNTGSLGSGHCIHHPAGSFKRATWLSSGGVNCFDPFDYDVYEITDGALQGGSSGSGIFNSSGQLFGQLFGTCWIDCGNNDVACADQVSTDFVYGEFESTWEDTDAGYWLTLGGTIWADAAYGGLIELGYESFPFDTLTEAHDLAWNGAQIKLVAGSYNETLTMNKAVTLKAVNGVATIGQ